MKKINKWSIVGVAALLAVVFLIGVLVGRLTVKEKVKIVEAPVGGGYYVSEKPITLIAFDFGAKNLSRYTYVRNLASGGNTGNLTISQFKWLPGKGINATNVSIEMITVGTVNGTIYFPDIADIDWIIDKSQMAKDNLTLTFGKTNNLLMRFKQVYDGGSTTQLYNISLNTTNGAVNVVFTGNLSQNVTGNRTYYNLIVDKRTGDISLITRDANNCSLKDVVYSTSIAPFNYSDKSGKVSFSAKSLNGIIIEKLGVHQNPMSGMYESLTVEHCNGNFVNP